MKQNCGQSFLHAFTQFTTTRFADIGALTKVELMVPWFCVPRKCMLCTIYIKVTTLQLHVWRENKASSHSPIADVFTLQELKTD